MRLTRLTRLYATLLGTVALTPAFARAQSLGPFRQFLAVEPYYVHTDFDPGRADAKKMHTEGFGARLWLNAAPFSANRALSATSLSLFGNFSPKRDGWSVLHYGVAVDQFLTHRPFAGFLDPLVSLGIGGYQTRSDVFVRNAAGTSVFAATDKRTRLAISPGLGLRIPFFNHFEIRGDARKAYMVNARGSSSGRRTLSHNEFTGGLGITF